MSSSEEMSALEGLQEGGKGERREGGGKGELLLQIEPWWGEGGERAANNRQQTGGIRKQTILRIGSKKP
jgi:hypothetical protein